MRTNKPFRIDDFISVEKHFERITERGLFDTEIQAENRELISFPNAFLIGHPITDDSQLRCDCLGNAVTGLRHQPFQGRTTSTERRRGERAAGSWFHILELGNFAVTYRVFGFHKDTEQLITAHSNLCRRVLEALLKETGDDEKIRLKKNLEAVKDHLKALEEAEDQTTPEDDTTQPTIAGDPEKPLT